MKSVKIRHELSLLKVNFTRSKFNTRLHRQVSEEQMVKEMTSNKNEQLNKLVTQKGQTFKRKQMDILQSKVDEILNISSLIALSKIKGESLKVLNLLKQKDLFNRREVKHDAIQLDLVRLERLYRELSKIVKEAEQKDEIREEKEQTELHFLVIENARTTLEALRLHFEALTKADPQVLSEGLQNLITQIDQAIHLFSEIN